MSRYSQKEAAERYWARFVPKDLSEQKPRVPGEPHHRPSPSSGVPSNPAHRKLSPEDFERLVADLRTARRNRRKVRSGYDDC